MDVGIVLLPKLLALLEARLPNASLQVVTLDQMLWHRRVDDDPGATMLRELVRMAAAGLAS